MPLEHTNEHFTAVGDTIVDGTIAETLRQLADTVRQLADADRIALYLGGGYGRSEGGALITQDGRHLPYNDLDFFVLSKGLSAGRRKKFDAQLANIAMAQTKALGVSVDFAPTKPIQKFRREQYTLMYQELLFGHRLVCGTDLLAGMSPRNASEVPPLEALRLLVNRGMGLLFAAQRLASTQADENGAAPDDATVDFAVRNLHKAALGMGDAILIALHRYDYAIERRLKIIQYDAHTNSVFAAIAQPYQAAAAFKTLPASSTLDPMEQITPYIGLWLDTARFFVAITTDRSPTVLETTRQLTDCLGSHPSFIGRGSCVNALRWLLKTRTAKPLRLLVQNPTVRLFSDLHETLHTLHENLDNQLPLPAALEMISARQRELIRTWELFN